MMDIIGEYSVQIRAFVVIVGGAYLASLLVMLLLRLFARAATKTKTALDDKVIGALMRPIRWAFVLGGVWVAADRALMLDVHAGRVSVTDGTMILAVLLGAYTIARVLKTVGDWYAEKVKRQAGAKVDRTLFRFVRRIANGAVYVIGIIIVLDQLGIEIGPLIAGLGIAGLAVALALQDTLANIFSAVYIAADRPIGIGEYVELSSGQKGFVHDIGWRSTKLKTLSGNMVIIPNATVAKNIVTNYTLESPETSFGVSVGVGYQSDLKKVEKVCKEVGKDIMKTVEGGIRTYEPIVRFQEFGDSSISMTMYLRAETFVAQYVLKHECIKALHARFAKEGIEIPFPQRDVHMMHSDT
jgi:small-conductance mechanosensitive channel